MTSVLSPESSQATPPQPERRATAAAAGIALAAFVALVAAVGVWRPSLPAPLPEGAPPSDFSAARAMKHLRVIAKEPHPIGSAAQGRVRDYLLGELTALGLAPEVQKTTGFYYRSWSPYRAGAVENVLGRLRGTGGGEPVLLVAHYDSVPNAPGANDDGCGVASLLEAARALAAGPPPPRDVLFLFTDGEEPGLFGAEAFVREHPLAKGVGVVLNFDARGGGGPVVLFETSDGNDGLIREFAAAAPQPVANSVSYEIYKLLPNDTDMSVFKRAGLPGLNFAYIEQFNRYHTAADSVENVDEQTLQHQGASALALARRFAELPGGRPAGEGNAVYFNLPGSTFVRYTQTAARVLTGLAVLLFVAAVALGFRRRLLKVGSILYGAGALFLCLIASILTVVLAWSVASALHPDFISLPWGDPYNGGAYTLGLVFLAVAVTSALYVRFRRRRDVYSLTVGALLWWVFFAVLTTLAVPGASYLFAWPLLFASAGLCVLLAAGGGGPVLRLVVLAVYALPGLLFISPLIRQVVVALTLDFAGAVVFLEVLLLGLMLPHLDLLSRAGKWLAPGLSALLALGFIAAGLTTAGTDRRSPKADSVFYGLDADTGEAVWVSTDRSPDEWTGQFFGGGRERNPLKTLFPQNERPYMKAAAPAAALPVPQVTLLDERTSGQVRTLRLRVVSPRGGREVWVYTEADAAVVATSVNGKELALEEGKPANWPRFPWALNFHGLPAEGVELTLGVKPGQSLRLRVQDRTDGLPQLPQQFGARPDYIIPRPAPLSDATLVSKSYTF
jgi:hypothetical protein